MSVPPLTYALFTTPALLQADSEADLTVVVSNSSSRAVACTSISFDFLEGTNSKDFFSDAKGIGTSPPAGWSISQSGSVFAAKPNTPANGKIGGAGLTFVFSNIKVNDQVGTTNLTITDVTGAGATKTVVPLAKFPPQFEVSELAIQPLPPITGGDNVTVFWAGSVGATYELQYEDADDNTVTISHVKDDPKEPLPATGSYTIENLVKDPTEFYLYATVAVPDQDQPLTVMRFLSVEVELKPVKITNFTATPNPVIGENNNVPVTLTWATDNADQVLLNNQVVEGESTIVPVNNTTTFTLQATGYEGPKFWPITVEVKEPAVQIVGPTASPAVVYGANNNVAVELSWQTANAELVLLNDAIIETQNTTEVINQTTTFRLKATGNEGPAIKDITVPVVDPGLTVGQTGNQVWASFGANPVHYSVRFDFHFPPQDSITGEAEDYSVDADVQGQGQVVTVSGGSFSGAVKQIEVTVTGFAGGPLTAWYTPQPPAPAFPPSDPPWNINIG